MVLERARTRSCVKVLKVFLFALEALLKCLKTRKHHHLFKATKVKLAFLVHTAQDFLLYSQKTGHGTWQSNARAGTGLISLQQLPETLQVPVPRGGVPGSPVSAAEVQSEGFEEILREPGTGCL